MSLCLADVEFEDRGHFLAHLMRDALAVSSSIPSCSTAMALDSKLAECVCPSFAFIAMYTVFKVQHAL